MKALTIKDFRDAYRVATFDDKSSFVFDGHEFLTSYAGYMCEYFELKNIHEKTHFYNIVKKE